MPESSENFTAQDWDDVRTAFASSIMVDTPISSLAQNLEGPDWPIKGSGESPSAYIDLTYEETNELLTLKGHGNKLNFLISILKDTLSFDDPFGDMVEHTKQSAERDNQLLKNMAKLGVAEDYPIRLTALDSDTREFCRLENLKTLGEFARFAQNMSQNVIVGGDFRKLLNALSYVNEKALSEVVPFRVGSTGLHLIECLAQTGDDTGRVKAVLSQFESEWTELKVFVEEGGDLSRKLMVLDNQESEAQVAAMVDSLLGKKPVAKKKVGFFARLFGK